MPKLSSRHIQHSHVPPTDLKATRHRIHDALVDNILRVHRHPSSNPQVYVGSAGEIIMDMRAFAVMPPKAFSATPTSSLIAVPFEEPTKGSRVSYLQTSVGPATLVLVRQLRLRQNPESSAHKHARRGKLDAEILDDVELAETWRPAVDLVSAAQELVVSEAVDDDGCEVLYGRAGLLYALLLLRSELQVTLSYLANAGKQKERVVREVEEMTTNENVQALVDDIIRRGEFGGHAYATELEQSERPKAPPLLWRWHGSRYLGAAHGVVGILHILLHAPPETIQPHWHKILGTIEWLLAIQDPLGNWPTKAGQHMPHISGGAATHQESKRIGVDEEYADALVQWCHGAPGFIMLFSALLRRTAASPAACPITSELRSSIIATTTRAAELVYTTGLVRKGIGLCHGVGGNVYALLAVSDALDTYKPLPPAPPHPSGVRAHAQSLSRTLSHSHSTASRASIDVEHAYWLVRAVHLADLATGYAAFTQEGEMRGPDHPYSLYEGLAGMCCAWAELDLRLSGGRENGNGGGGPRRGGMPGYDDLSMLE